MMDVDSINLHRQKNETQNVITNAFKELVKIYDNPTPVIIIP
jgi:hypothetical protein